MGKLLITGASGNVGQALLEHLSLDNYDHEVLIARHQQKKAEEIVDGQTYRLFDFLDQKSWEAALKDIDRVFLLRPPKIADVKAVFIPLIQAMEKAAVKGVVFLSVQGADKMSWVPHYKIERALESSALDYIFIRPSYFMQNLTTTLSHDIVEKKEIHLPAAEALFNWVDVSDIGEAAARCMTDFPAFKNQSFTISGPANLSFPDIIRQINEKFHTEIRYVRRTPVGFLFYKMRGGTPFNFAIIQLILHYLPRFSDSPEISEDYNQLTGNSPTTFDRFLDRTASFWQGLR